MNRAQRRQQHRQDAARQAEDRKKASLKPAIDRFEQVRASTGYTLIEAQRRDAAIRKQQARQKIVELIEQNGITLDDLGMNTTRATRPALKPPEPASS